MPEITFLSRLTRSQLQPRTFFVVFACFDCILGLHSYSFSYFFSTLHFSLLLFNPPPYHHRRLFVCHDCLSFFYISRHTPTAVLHFTPRVTLSRLFFSSYKKTKKTNKMRFTAALLSTLVALASAYTKPDYTQSPTGNAISKPAQNESVTTGKPYTIEWEPTTKGPISLVLLRGPSTNIKPIHTVAESIDNTGSYEWTPSSDLEPDTKHYGLMLVVEGTGQYQYSTQFGVKNENYESVSASSTATAATTAPPADFTSFYTTYTTYNVTKTVCPMCSLRPSATPSTVTSKSTAPVHVASALVHTPAPATSAPATATTTGSSSTSSPTFTGAASQNTVGLGAVAAGVLAVLAF